MTVPDAVFAVRDPRAALAAGLDLPALGDDGGRTEADLREVGTATIDEIVTHVLAAAEHVGLERPRKPSSEPPAGSAELARRIATDGMVLLTNRDDTLPLPRSARVALIDAVGVRNVLVMGGAVSVTLTDDRIQSVSDALRERLTDTGGEVDRAHRRARGAAAATDHRLGHGGRDLRNPSGRQHRTGTTDRPPPVRAGYPGGHEQRLVGLGHRKPAGRAGQVRIR